MSAVVASNEHTLPLSPEQRAFLSMGGAQAAESVQLRIDIEGGIDPARLRQAVTKVLQAHEALGMCIRQVAGYRGLRMLPGQHAPLGWREIDLRDAAPAALQSWMQDLQAEALDVARGQLLRVGFARTGEASHTLAVVVSALVADRGSLRVLANQIAMADLGQGPGAELFQYPQYVEWRQDLELGEESEAGRAYWSGYLQQAGSLAAPRLAYRRRGAATPGAARVRAWHAVDAALAGRVAALAASAGTDAEVVLQAVWWLLLARLTGFQSCAGGWQHDCRRDYQVMQDAVGVFEKVLPVAVAVQGEESFVQWLERLAAVAASHVQAQEYWAVDAPPQAAHLAVGFAFHDAAMLGNSRWQMTELPGALPCFELALQVDWSTQGGGLAVLAQASLYSQSAVERLLEQYLTLLEGALARPDSAVSELPWVGAQEREQLRAWQGAQADVGTQPLAARIARWAQQTPDAPAIEAAGQRLSYRELDARANRLAQWLRARGVRPGGLVALELPRSPDLLVAIVAAWRAGAAYLPLEPDWPAGRRQAVLADARPALVLRAVPMDADAPLPCPEACVAEIALDDFVATDPAHEISLDDPAYVLYTSGSTGQPKGVMIAQRQLLNYVAAASQVMDLGTCRRWGLTSSVVADLGNTALFCAWFNGACVVVADRYDVEDAEAFARFMAAGQVDALKMVPSHLEALLECEAPRLPRVLVLGGEAAPGALVQRIARLAPGCVVYNHYGPTETTIGVMVHQVGDGGAVPEVLPLTRVLPNNRVHVLDAAMRPVPAGALGELYIGGAQLCRGYLNRAVEGIFVPDPFEPGGLLYRTGDLAHVLPEGGIRLAGRADHQVKIRGFRVEPAEVEAALLAQPGVGQAVVLALPDPHGATELAAFVGGDAELASAQGRQALRERLAGLLPAHMLPARSTWVAEFPRLPNGKIDRLALRALANEEQPTAQAVPASSDAVEAAIAQCMAALLDRPAIGAGDDFFEVGGHSLLAIKLAARLRKLLQVELAPGAVFDHRSPSSLAAFLRKHPGDTPSLDARARQALVATGESHAPPPAMPDPEGIHVVHGRGQRVPLFCFPGLFASALEYRAILDALPPDRPVHSFVCHTLTRARWHGWRLEELAAAYSRYIVNIAGRGPVALLGWSVGGDLAFEVASQLAASGVELRLVALLDVMRPISTQLRAGTGQKRADAEGALSAWIEGSSMRNLWQELFARLDDEEKLLAKAFLCDHVISSLADGDGTDAVEYRAWARINHGAMMRRHSWRPGPVPAYVWRAEQSVMNAREQLRNWGNLADVRRESTVAGCEHRTLLDDAGMARELAAQLLAIDG